MQLKIAHKLILLALIPIVTLLIFSINHLNDKYAQMQLHSKQLVYAEFIKLASSVLYVLQIERGLSTSYISNNNVEDNHKKLQKQYELSAIVFRKSTAYLETLDLSVLTKLQLVLIDGITSSIQTIGTIRESLLTKDISPDEVFYFYTNINNQILDLSTSLNIHMEDELIQNKVFALYKLLELQEKAGQERALICTFDISKQISTFKLQKFHSLAIVQGDLQTSIFNFFYKTKNSLYFSEILNSNTYPYITEIRKKIENHKFDKNNNLDINLNIWFNQTSKKIFTLNSLSKKIYEEVIEYEKNKQIELKSSIFLHIFLTFTTILLLIFGTYTIVKYINSSISKLGNGIGDFFDYLEFKKITPTKIDIICNDEIGLISKDINTQIDLLQNSHELDQIFINETTNIVRKMQDGNFKQNSKSSPHNPHLKDLQQVLKQLIRLITTKIEAQTKNLEALNFSLEDKVIRQTHELQKKVFEMTEARDKAVLAEKSKDEFLANMSHEIRTPLNAILGFVTILKKQTNDEKSLNYLNIIDNSSQSLLTIINDILDFSKIQSGSFTINLHRVNLSSECANVMMLFASSAYEKNITYAIYIDPNLPNEVNIDSIRVKQIISNLLSNAIKFTPKNGEIKVKVSINNSIMKISVKDTGIGISSKNQKKIFKAFEQADGSTTREYGGTGLGLSISLNLANLMKGELSLKSTEAKGATFTLTLPIEITQNNPIHNYETKFSNKDIKIFSSTQNNSTYSNLLMKYLKDYGFKRVEIIDAYTKDYELLFFFDDEKEIDKITTFQNKSIEICHEFNNKFDNNGNISQLLIPFFGSSIMNAIKKA